MKFKLNIKYYACINYIIETYKNIKLQIDTVKHIYMNLFTNPSIALSINIQTGGFADSSRT